jgi:putative ABC transport system permease protein
LESAMLSIAAGSLGLVAGIAAVRVLLAINPSYLTRVGDNGAAVTVDWRVFLFTAFVSLLTGLTCGVLPALRARRTDVNAGLNERRAFTGQDPRLVRGTLVVIETALALVLVIGAALLIRTFVSLRTVEPGFESRGVLNVPMTLAGSRFETTAAVAQVVRDGITRLRGIPGVVEAAAGCCPPMLGRYQLPFIVSERPLDGPSHGLGGWVNVSPDYFDLFKVPVIRGRTFTDFDTTGAPGVVVINQTMARRFWPDGDPLNERLLIGQGFGPAEEPARQIVGVVGDVRDGGLEGEPVPMMYVPTAQMTDGYTALHARLPILWFVRADVDVTSLAPAIARELHAASGGVPIAATMIRSMDQLMAESTSAPQFQTALMTIFACVSLLLAALGVYGVTAHAVQQRTREIGIRIAMGAQPHQVRNMVLAQGLTLVLLGVALGIAGAFGVTRVLVGFLFGVTPRDPLVFVGVPALLVAVAVAAIWLPARRATHLSPVAALRAE